MAYAYVEARWFTRVAQRGIDLIVLHTPEYAERATAAEELAQFFHTISRKASTHAVCDNNSVVECVHDMNVAYGASGANHNGLHIEIAGAAGQSAAQWADKFSHDAIAQAAMWAAGKVKTYGIPVRFVDARGLRAGVRGITTHHEVEAAFPSTGHWDPGPNFPTAQFLDAVRYFINPHPILPNVPWPTGAAWDPATHGMWLLTNDGAVGNFVQPGKRVKAPEFGDLKHKSLVRPVCDIAAHPRGHGYWIASEDGGVFTFGDTKFYGSVGGHPLHRPIVAIEPHPRGSGYWLLGSDGGIFSFKTAYHGSLGGKRLNKPAVAMASTPNGDGYWIVTRDGGVFTFGKAKFFGALPGKAVVSNIVAIRPTLKGDGYFLLGADGGIFAFGKAGYSGSYPALKPKDRLGHRWMLDMAVEAADTYDLLASDGAQYRFA